MELDIYNSIIQRRGFDPEYVESYPPLPVKFEKFALSRHIYFTPMHRDQLNVTQQFEYNKHTATHIVWRNIISQRYFSLQSSMVW